MILTGPQGKGGGGGSSVIRACSVIRSNTVYINRYTTL